MTKMSETRIHRQQNLGLVEEGFICYLLLSGKYKCEDCKKMFVDKRSLQKHVEKCEKAAMSLSVIIYYLNTKI